MILYYVQFFGDMVIYFLFIHPLTTTHETAQKTYITVYSLAFLSGKCVKLYNLEIGTV
jgi:hypothetical protein